MGFTKHPNITMGHLRGNIWTFVAKSSGIGNAQNKLSSKSALGGPGFDASPIRAKQSKTKRATTLVCGREVTWHHDEMMHDPNEKRATEPCKCNSAKPTSWLGQGHNIVQAHPITHYHHGVASKEDPGYVPVVFRTWLACFGAVIQSVLKLLRLDIQLRLQRGDILILLK